MEGGGYTKFFSTIIALVGDQERKRGERRGRIIFSKKKMRKTKLFLPGVLQLLRGEHGALNAPCIPQGQYEGILEKNKMRER